MDERGKMTKLHDKEAVRDLYVNQKLSLRDIGELYGVSQEAVRLRMITWDIPTRGLSESVSLAIRRRKKSL
jgi:hypothetical protein